MKNSALLIMMLFMNHSFAYDANGPWTRVDRMYTNAKHGSVFVYFKTGAMPGCYAERGGYISTTNDQGAEKMYSAILAALMADRDIRVYYNYIEGESGWNMCHIEAVYLR